MPQLNFDSEGNYIVNPPPKVLTVEEQRDLTVMAFRPVDWESLWADDTEDGWILEPLIPDGGQTVIYSAPKVGKSLLMLEIAAGLAAGRSLLGNAAQEPMSVVYFDHENRLRADVRKRLRDMGYKPSELTNLHMYSFPRMDKLDTATGGEQLLALAQHHTARLVIIDTVSRTIRGEENNNDTWIQFYSNTGQLLKAAGIAMARLDHTGKDEERGQRGGSAKSGDVDMVWRLKTVVEGEVYTLECEASRVENAERMLTIKRHSEPLKHTVDAMGIYGALEAKAAALLAILDRTGAPKDIGAVEATTWLRDRGQKISNGQVTKRMLEARRLGTS